MLVAQSMYHVPPRGLHSSLIKRMIDMLHQHHGVREIVAYGDDGEVIGRVIAPRENDVFGAGRAAVFLTRE